MKPTRQFIFFLERLFPYRFFAAKLTRLPFMRHLINKMLFDTTNLTVLPRETQIEIKLEKSIQSPDNIVLPSKVVEYFIKKASYRFIMNFCICREAMDCKNHPINFGCLFLGDAARGINSEFGREASVEKAIRHVHNCREEGLIHVIGRDKIDETWLDVGSDGKLLTICNCCTCCCLWKMLSNLDPQISSKVKRMPGVEIKVTEKCTGCGMCIAHCFINAIRVEDGKAIISNNCKCCGRCADMCPNKAIEITINDKRFLQKTIDRIESSVNVS